MHGHLAGLAPWRCTRTADPLATRARFQISEYFPCAVRLTGFKSLPFGGGGFFAESPSQLLGLGSTIDGFDHERVGAATRACEGRSNGLLQLVRQFQTRYGHRFISHEG